MYINIYFMVKTTIAITIDAELIEKFKKQETNISKAISELIERSLNIQNSIISTVDKQLLEIEYEKAKKEQIEANIKLKELEEQKEKLTQETENIKLAELQKQKEIEENALKCIKCNSITFENRRVKMKGGFMCRFCFSNMTREDMKIYA